MPLARNGLRCALVLDHRRDAPPDLEANLRRAGFDVTVSRTVADSARLVAEGHGWGLAVLNPLVIRRGGVELGMLEQLQRDDPVPCIVLADSRDSLAELRTLEVPLRDFLIRPFSIEELMHRVESLAAAFTHIRELAERARELQGQVAHDFKTGLPSEKHFRDLLHVEFKRAQRNHTALSLLLIDVDDFKRINDTTDYAFGDEVLVEVAKTLKSSCRETDFPGRFGGDEFALLLPQTKAVEAVQTAMRIRQRIRSREVKSERYATKVTISIGIDTFDGHTSSTPEELRRRANKALHDAKRRGKDQVSLYSDLRDSDDLEPPASSRGR